MEEKDTVVVFGGSFNPPLNSHFSIAQQVLNQYEKVEKVIFVPVNKKYEKNDLEKNHHRYNMLKEVVENNKDFMVSDMDLYGDRSLYIIEIIEEIQKQFKDKKISILIGSDNLKEFHTWKNAEELLSKYNILVMERNTDNIEDIITGNQLLNKYKNSIKKINIEIKSNFNSTYVREQIKNGKSVRYLLPDEVYKYIEKNNLYKERVII